MKAQTKKQALKKIKELLSTANRNMIKDAELMLDSETINLSKYEDNYLLPKILISAILEREANGWLPLKASAYVEAKRLANY